MLSLKKSQKRRRGILLISQYFYPDITAAAFRMHGLYKYLASRGFNISVITSFPHRSLVSKDGFSKEEGVYRVKVHYSSPESFIKSVLYYLEFPYKSFFIFLRRKLWKSDVIIVSSPPIFVAVSAFLISFIFRKKLLLDVRDLWPDTIADLGKMSRTSAIFKILKRIEIYLYRKAYAVFCVSKYMKEYISNYSKNVKVVYNGINMEDLRRFKNNPEVPKRRDYINVFYAGNLGLAQPLDFIFEAAVKLKERNVKILIHLVGSGVRLKEYKQLAGIYNLSNLVFHEPLPRKDLLAYLYNEADVLILPLKDGFAFKRTIPSKLFDYLLIKKPVLYHASGETDEILSKLGIGVKFDLNSDSFLKALTEITLNYNKYLKNASNNNFTVLEKFEREVQFEKVLQVLSEIKGDK